MATTIRVLVVTLALASLASGAGHPRNVIALSMNDVRSFNYFIAPGFDGAPSVGQQFERAAAEDYDLLIADYYSGHRLVDADAVRKFQDSSPRGRLAIAYLDAGEFMRCCSNVDPAQQESWFDRDGELTATAPAWLGPRNPKFKNLWSVRNWDPRWQQYILGEIDKMIALGFDGVFLDVLYSDSTWGPHGSAAGKAGTTDYRAGQMGLARAIWNHVRSQQDNPRFVIITNYSGVMNDNAQALGEGVNYADAFMKESDYFGRDDKPAPWVGGRSMEQYFADRYAHFYRQMLQRGKRVLLQDYNLSFDNQALLLEQAAKYGYLVSATHFPQNLIHIDGLPACTPKTCTAVSTTTAKQVSFDRTSRAP